MSYIYSDGGRAEAGFKGAAGDCVTRAIAIATRKPYQEVYDELFATMRDDKKSRGKSPRSGVRKTVIDKYLKSLGWVWTPTMFIGSGCKVHLKASELPRGRIIVRASKHLCAVIDGMVYDTFDPSRGGTRCVYGYYRQGEGVSNV